MRIGWIGFHAEGVPALEALLEQGALSAVITLPPDLASRRSGAADYEPVCRRYGVPLYHVRNINDPEALELLAELSLDLAFVIGWTQLVRRPARSLIRNGVIGAHASLLPIDRGRAPVNWALINGRTETGNSLLWLADDADTGELIDQTRFPITPYDTCATLYARVAESNRAMILGVLPDLLAGRRPGAPQPDTGVSPLPARHPADGLIDWSLDSARVYDFIRAQTRPYPGAFTWFEDSRWRVWNAALFPGDLGCVSAPGELLGAVVSPVNDACGQLCACGTGALILLEMEDDGGNRLRGQALSSQRWKGKGLGRRI
jgi:methionyl-tRNA formyltransferase